MACQIAQYQGIRKVIGDEKFNILFKGRLMIGDYLSSHRQNPLMAFLKPAHDAKDHVVKDAKKHQTLIRSEVSGVRDLSREQAHIPIGSRILFRNVPKYTSKHLIGDSAAFNVIYMGRGLYLGLGFDKHGVTKKLIQGYLIESYNYPPLSSERLDKKSKEWYHALYSKYSKPLEQDQVDQGQFKDSGVGYDGFPGKALDIALIRKIIETPVKKVSWRMVSRHSWRCSSLSHSFD